MTTSPGVVHLTPAPLAPSPSVTAPNRAAEAAAAAGWAPNRPSLANQTSAFATSPITSSAHPPAVPIPTAPVPPFAVSLDGPRLSVTLALFTSPGSVSASVAHGRSLHVDLNRPQVAFSLRFASIGAEDASDAGAPPGPLQKSVAITHNEHSTVLHVLSRVPLTALPPYVHLCAHDVASSSNPSQSSVGSPPKNEHTLSVLATAAFCTAQITARAIVHPLRPTSIAHPFGFALRFTLDALPATHRSALAAAVALPHAAQLPPWRRGAARAALEDAHVDFASLLPDAALPPSAAIPPYPPATHASPPAAIYRAYPSCSPREHASALVEVSSLLAALFAAHRAVGALPACAPVVVLLAPPLAALEAARDVRSALRAVARRVLVYGPVRSRRLAALACDDLIALLRQPTRAVRAMVTAWLVALRGALLEGQQATSVHVALFIDPLLGWVRAAPDSVFAKWAEAVLAVERDGGVADARSLEWPPHLLEEAWARPQGLMTAAQAAGGVHSPTRAERAGPPSDETTSSASDNTSSSSTST